VRIAPTYGGINLEDISAPRVPQITELMKLAAASAIAGLVEKPTADEIVPRVFQDGVADAVAAAVARLV
jgi:malic enzyme